MTELQHKRFNAHGGNGCPSQTATYVPGHMVPGQAGALAHGSTHQGKVPGAQMKLEVVHSNNSPPVAQQHLLQDPTQKASGDSLPMSVSSTSGMRR